MSNEDLAPGTTVSSEDLPPLTNIRFSAELCGLHEMTEIDVKERQQKFADSLRAYFSGRVPVGSNMPFIGLDCTNSRTPEVGTVVVGDVLVFLAAEDEVITQACNAYHDPKFPVVFWERMTEENEKARAEKKAERNASAEEYVSAAMKRLEKNRGAKKEPTPSGTEDDPKRAQLLEENPEALL